MELYDDFSGACPSEDKWQVAAVPLGPDEFWFYRDDNAKVDCAKNRCEIDIPVFSKQHSQVQIFDNPKQLFLATRAWETGAGPLSFSTTMSGAVSGNPEDYRDGFASFNVLDFASAMVFDIVSNGSHLWAIYERLLLPGVTTGADAFTEVIDLGLATSPEQIHELQITYDAAANSVSYCVDGTELLVRDNIPVPVKQLTTGFGLITLHPIEDGKSVSCKGQGGKGSWGAFSVS